MKVNGKDDIPYIMENEKCSKPPTSSLYLNHVKTQKNWFLSLLTCLKMDIAAWKLTRVPDSWPKKDRNPMG